MIGIGLNIGNRVMGGGFDADAQAFFNRVTAAGGSLTTTEQTATNQLVLDMKSAGIWTAMKAIYPMVGASAAACAQNLKSSSFTGSFTSGWTFASSGITSNGTSAYFNTTVTNNTDLTDRASHWSAYLRTLGNEGWIGYYSAADNGVFGVQLRAPLDKIGVGLNNLATTGIGGFGYLVGSVNSSTDAKLYLNNLLVYTLATPNPILQNLDFYLGALNSSGSPIIYGTQENAFLSLGDNLNNTQASNLYTCVQTFQTTLSRQV